MYLYHATYSSLIDEISKHGLIPGKNKNWEDSDSDFIYLASDPEIAYDFAVNTENEKFENDDIFVITIDADELDLLKLYADPNIDFEDDEEIYSFIYEGIIFPEAFVDIENIDQ